MPAITSISKTRGKARAKVVEKRRITQDMLQQLHADDLEVTVALIQSLIHCGLEAEGEKLKAEV